MVSKLSERKKREATAMQSGNTKAEDVSDTELFGKMGVTVKHGN